MHLIKLFYAFLDNNQTSNNHILHISISLYLSISEYVGVYEVHHMAYIEFNEY